ncbi:MAG: molybdopterin molybdotransferase MoeA [Nitrososphaerales archaeon]
MHEDDHVHYHGVDKAEKHIRVDEALKLFLANIVPVNKSESVKLSEALGRILFKDVKSSTNVPKRARSTRDGYAVRVKKGATCYSLVGDVRIGVVPKLSLKKGEAAFIATGSYVPSGADAVVMKEYARVAGSLLIIDRPAIESENILGPGEDILAGAVILRRGTTLRSQHISILSMLGLERVSVFKRPRIAFFSTGDELVDAGRKKRGIYDANRPFIRSMLLELGAEPHDLGIAPDNFEKINRRMSRGLKFDGLILSAGSSIGERDYVSKAADAINGVRTLVHGVAMRPSSPTGLAVFRKKPFILLPGFPTSAIVSFFVFAVPAVLRLSGTSETPALINARLKERYEGKQGVKHYVRVRVSRKNHEYVASIVRPSEAYFSRWLAEANGIAVIGEDESPIDSGDSVPVFLIGSV